MMIETYKVFVSQEIQRLLGEGWESLIHGLVDKELHDYDKHSATRRWCQTRHRVLYPVARTTGELAIQIDRREKEVAVGTGEELPPFPDGVSTGAEWALSDEQWARIKETVVPIKPKRGRS